MSAEQRASRVGRALVRIALTVIAGVAVGIVYVIVFVVARTGTDDLPLSISLGYGALFAIPMGVVLSVAGALGAMIARLLVGRDRPLVIGAGSVVGGVLATTLIAGTGISPAGILYFAMAALGQAVVTGLVVSRRSATEVSRI